LIILEMDMNQKNKFLATKKNNHDLRAVML